MRRWHPITEEMAFDLTTWRGDTNIDFKEPMADPFVNCTMTTKYGWWDRLRILFGGEVTHVALIGGKRDVCDAVMRLRRDEDTDEIFLPELVSGDLAVST